MLRNSSRLPRFTRAPQKAGGFRVTPRDLQILRVVAEHRFIRSEWIARLAGGSYQQVIRRLHLLYHHSYLDRPRAQIDYYHEGGSHSMIYGLASRGAGRLRRDLNMPFERMDWTTRNRHASRLLLEHTVLLSDFMATQLIEGGGERKRFVNAEDLDLRADPRKSGPIRWSYSNCGGRRMTLIPDKVFAFDEKDQNGKVTRSHYLVEADRGTMPIKRSNPRQTSIMQKLHGYHLLSRVLHRLPPRTFVVIVSASPQRLANIVAEIRKAALPSSLFKMAHPEGMELPDPAE
ncbi:replication-relaxation family protein [Prosthecobacter sp.]|uniref:replication-relaxation family protein n=1 Tax=Prosthecobacter sp. TaxID=1965333 RepID=UPI0037834F66